MELPITLMSNAPDFSSPRNPPPCDFTADFARFKTSPGVPENGIEKLQAILFKVYAGSFMKIMPTL